MSQSSSLVKKKLAIASIAVAVLLAAAALAVAQSDRVSDIPMVQKDKPAPYTGTPKVEELKDLTVQRFQHGNVVYLSGVAYKYSSNTQVTGFGNKIIGARDLRPGDVVDVVYYTGKKMVPESQPFDPRDKVLTTVRLVSRGR